VAAATPVTGPSPLGALTSRALSALA
jgi:hypothetical protein